MLYQPAISIVIITWNSSGYISKCLLALSKQTFQDFETIIVDNGSADDTVNIINSHQPQLNIRIKQLDKNLGFAAANNIGAQIAQGNWLALLNADAFPEQDWLEQLLAATQKNPDFTFFSSRQIQYEHPELLDGAGDEYHVSGLAWRRYYNHNQKEYGIKSEEVFSACAAASMYLKEDFLKIGGFDENYFSYFEDVDLSFRLRLIGGRCLYAHQAAVYHVGSASAGKMSDFVIYHGHRNLEWAYLKNMPWALLWLYLPLHILTSTYFLISFTLKGKQVPIFKAKLDAIRGIPLILQKRKISQKTRTANILEIHRALTKGLLSPYWASRQRKSSENEDYA